MLIDRETRFVLSNTPLSFSDNMSVDGIYYGILPEKYLMANSAIYIDSTLYACVSITNDIPKEDRMIEVCLHEMCHYWVEKNNIHLSYKKYQLTHGVKVIVKRKDVEIGFNPNEMFAIDTLCTYFSLLYISGDFGFLKPEKGAILQNDVVLFFID
jgi:hypothetical protein